MNFIKNYWWVLLIAAAAVAFWYWNKKQEEKSLAGEKDDLKFPGTVISAPDSASGFIPEAEL